MENQSQATRTDSSTSNLQGSTRHIAITGAAGFIGHHLAERLLGDGHTIVGIDDLNAYYPVALKKRRLDRLVGRPGFRFVHADVAKQATLDAALGEIDQVVHLAAWPGIGASARHPDRYVDANLVGFANVLEASRRRQVPLLFASSSSVYGTKPPPLRGPPGAPQSLYAATKAANEAMAQAYTAQHGLHATAVRFFNIYGPWGRPDMAVWRFTRQIEAGEPLRLRNHGRMVRDLVAIEDAVEAVARLLRLQAPGWSVVNVGRGVPVTLFDLVGGLERALGRSAAIELVELPQGEVVEAWADITELVERTGFRPSTGLDEGLPRFVEWYRSFSS